MEEISNALEVIGSNLNIKTMLSEENGIDSVISAIKKEVSGFVPDISCKEGRAEIKSLAYKISQSKTHIDNVGKELTSEWKEKSKKVDAERKKVRDELDALKLEVRRPLTDWESEQEEKEKETLRVIKFFKDAQFIDMSKTLNDYEMDLIKIESLQINDEIIGDFKDSIEIEKTRAIEITKQAIEKIKKDDAEKLELAILRKKQEERDREDYERKLKEEAAKKATAEMEEKLRLNKLEAERKEQEAKDYAARVEREKREAEEKSKREIAEANERAERKAKEEYERREQLRIREEEKQKAKEEKRQKNIDHQREINRSIVSDLIECGLDEVSATNVTRALVCSKIRNVFVRY